MITSLPRSPSTAAGVLYCCPNESPPACAQQWYALQQGGAECLLGMYFQSSLQIVNHSERGRNKSL